MSNIETEMTTEELLEQRHQVYGDRVSNMENVGTMWSGYLRARFPDVDITGTDVAVMMALYKTYRMSVEPEYSDSIDDVDGYMAMARETIGDRLIKARTVDEFIQKRAERDRPQVELVKRYLTPEELADDNLYVPTMEDLDLITHGAGTPPIQHQCYNIGHTPTDSKICARCGEPMYGHPDWAEFITAQKHPLEQAAAQHLEEACVNCRNTTCDGNCEDERIAEEQAMSQQWFGKTEPVTADTARRDAAVEAVREQFNRHNSFVYGHAIAAKVAVEALLKEGWGPRG